MKCQNELRLIVSLLAAVSIGCAAKNPSVDVDDKARADAMILCSAGWDSKHKAELEAEIEGRGGGITFDDTRNVTLAVLKDVPEAQRVKLTELYYQCLKDHGVKDPASEGQ